MMSWRAFSAALLLLLASGGGGRDAAAFTPRTRAEITGNAITLMPDSLERQLRRHAERLYRGALEHEPGQPVPGVEPLDVDHAAGRLAGTVDAAVRALDAHEPMATVAERFGAIARAVQDLCMATHLGPFDPRHEQFHAEYARYIESKTNRIRPVFSGFANPHLARGDVEGFARGLAERVRQDYPFILQSYFPQGRQRLPQDFDERSVAFAVASLEYSLAVTATARAWLYAWQQAHGDMEGAAPVGKGPAGSPFSIPPRSADPPRDDAQVQQETPP